MNEAPNNNEASSGTSALDDGLERMFEEWAGNPPVEFPDMDRDPVSFWCWKAWQKATEIANAASVWQPLETAPRDRTVVLMVGRGMRHADGYWEPGAYNGNGAWIWPYVHCNPTHWMPLPAFPKVGDSGTAMRSNADLLDQMNAEELKEEK